MKTFLVTLIAIGLVSIASAQSQAFSLAWTDPNPPTNQVTSYNVYKKTAGVYMVIGTVLVPNALKFALTAPLPGDIYAVSCVSVLGESPKSPDMVWPSPAIAPTGLKITSP